MSYVEAVKEKHRFEQSMRDLSRYLNVMTIEEIELAAAHIADDIVVEQSDTKKLNGLIKGAAIRAYLNLRFEGRSTQKKFQRLIFRGEMKRHFENIGLAQHEEAVAKRKKRITALTEDRERAMINYERAKAEWIDNRDELPFIKRLFYGKPKPKIPDPVPAQPIPPEPAMFVKQAQSSGTLEVFFVAVVRQFELLGLPGKPVEFAPEEMVFLSK